MGAEAKPLRLLLVDDEVDFLELMEERLVARGIEVATSSSAEDALKAGVVDHLYPEPSLLEDAKRFAQSLIQGRAFSRRSKKNWMSWFLEDTPVGRAVVFSKARKDVLKKTKGVYPAPLEIIKLISKTYGRRGPKVFRLESEHFANLGTTDISKNLIKLFFLSDKYKKLHWTQVSLGSDGVQKCGVIGAGIGSLPMWFSEAIFKATQSLMRPQLQPQHVLLIFAVVVDVLNERRKTRQQ